MARRRGRGRRRRGGGRRRGRKGGFRGRTRRFFRRHSIKLGILAKIGVATSTLPPAAFTAFDGLTAFMAKGVGVDSATIFEKIRFAGATALDSIAVGFGLAKPFGFVPMTNAAGGQTNITTSVSPPSGVYRVTLGLGLTLIVTDMVQSFLVNFMAKRGKRGTKVFGVQATTGR